MCLVCASCASRGHTVLLCFFPLAHPRAVTLSPQHSHPVPTKLPCRATMATRRDARYNQTSRDTCVTTRSPVINDWSNTSGPILQRGSLNTTKRTRRVRQFLFLCSGLGRESSSSSTQIAESHGGPSPGQSGEHVEVRVTGLFLPIP